MNLILPHLPELLDRAADEAEGLAAAIANAVGGRVLKDGRLDRRALDEEQHVAHGLAWAAAYAQTLRQTSEWANALAAKRRLHEAEALPAQLLAHEYLSQLAGGIPMNQGEVFRPADVFAPAERMTSIIGRLRPGAARR
jgi:(2S)-methylsuccinyl-CoA dehydrogenase